MHKPSRMCAVCRSKKNKESLVRVVRNKENGYFVDLDGKADGRGAYICKDKQCIDKCIAKKTLNRSFKCEVPIDVYRELERIKSQD